MILIFLSINCKIYNHPLYVYLMKLFDPTFFSRTDKIGSQTAPDANQSSTSWHAAMHPTRWHIHQVLPSFCAPPFLCDCYLCRWTHALLTCCPQRNYQCRVCVGGTGDVYLTWRLMLCELTDGRRCLCDCIQSVRQDRCLQPSWRTTSPQ